MGTPATRTSMVSQHAEGKRKKARSIFGKGLVEAMDGRNGAKVYDPEDQDPRPQLVIVGGGFAGVQAAQKMQKHFTVTLIDCKEYFEYYPGICRAYVHPKEHRKLSRHYLTICDSCNADFVWAEVKSINTKEKTVEVDNMATNALESRRYDYLLVTAGCQYGVDLVHDKRASHGTECLWYPTFLKESIDVSKWSGKDERFLIGRRRHIEDEYKVLIEMDQKNETILVVGAGFVGIEFATEVKHYFPGIDVVVVESRNDCIGAMPDSCIRYAQRYMDKNDIKCLYGIKYTSFLEKEGLCSSQWPGACDGPNSMRDIGGLDKLKELSQQWGINEPARVYMAVGLRSINKFMPTECITESKGSRGGWIKVNMHQQVLGADGKPIEGVFAAGNCCDAPGGELNVPKNVAPAETMSAVACHNIKVVQGQRNSRSVGGGCFGICRPRKMQKMHYNMAIGMCATSLGPHDATIVAGCKDPKTGCFFLWGYPAALTKEFIRWSKVDAVNGGCLGTIVWKLIH